MTVTIRPELERLIARAIDSGVYRNPEEVIIRALEVLSHDEEWLRENSPSIDAKIERAFAQCERGESLTPEQSRADMRTRKAAWRADQHG